MYTIDKNGIILWSFVQCSSYSLLHKNNTQLSEHVKKHMATKSVCSNNVHLCPVWWWIRDNQSQNYISNLSLISFRWYLVFNISLLQLDFGVEGIWSSFGVKEFGGVSFGSYGGAWGWLIAKMGFGGLLYKILATFLLIYSSHTGFYLNFNWQY